MRHLIVAVGATALVGTVAAFALPAWASAPARTAAAHHAARHTHRLQRSSRTSPVSARRAAAATSTASTTAASTTAGSLSSTSGGAQSSTKVTCDNGRWPIGPTRVHAGEPNGVYLRSTGQDVVIDVTHQGEVRYQYSGTVTSDGVIRATAAKLRPRDHYSVSSDGHTLTFDFKNYGGLTGVHITSKCGSSLTLQASTDQKGSRLRRFAPGKGSGQMTQGQSSMRRKRSGWLGVPVTFTRNN
jgi:hypothetical protein